MRAYLDYNASAPLRPEAREAVVAALDIGGNPSSVHSEGRAARAVVERARAQVARLAGCEASEVVFTSGATEAASVLSSFGGVAVQETAHDCLWAHRSEGPDGVLAWGHSSGETGIVCGVPEGHAGPLLLDVTQSVGRVPFCFAESGADYAVLSSHKIGGPRGVGALIVHEGFEAHLQRGGGQELGRRSGTENVAGIAGFGAAADVARAELEAGAWDEVADLRDWTEAALEEASPMSISVGKGEARLPNTICFATPGWRGETQVIQMDLAGYAVSAGSACSSGKVAESRVLKAMGLGGLAGCAVRISLGPRNTKDEVAGFVAAWKKALDRREARAA